MSGFDGKNFIGGDWRPAASGHTFEQRNPAFLHEVTGKFADSSPADADSAIAAAQAAFPAWRALSSLARYGAVGNGGLRGTSTSRDDTGDGACETILVDDFEIVVPGFSGWRAAMWTSLVILVATLTVHFMLPYRPYRD